MALFSEKTYNIFISHSWKYEHQYLRVAEMLDQSGLKWRDHSVPKDDPIHTQGSDAVLREAINSKIRGCSGVIILAGVYATYSRWINIEIELSRSWGKSIIAVEPPAAMRTSLEVKAAASEIVSWNYRSLANAVRTHF